MEYYGMGDKEVLAEVGGRMRRERLNQNITQQALADRAGVSRTVIQRLEGGQGCTLGHLIRVLRALGLLARIDAFLPEPGPSPVQLARMAGMVRERASGYGGRPAGDEEDGED